MAPDYDDTSVVTKLAGSLMTRQSMIVGGTSTGEKVIREGHETGALESYIDGT